MLSLVKRGGRTSAAGVLLAMLTLTVATTARAADKPSEADNALEMKARESFAAGRYDDAIDAFAKMYAKTLNPVYLRNIGRCFQKKREPQPAIDKFRDYLGQTKSGKYKISGDERAEIEGYIKDMEALKESTAPRDQPIPVPPAPAPAMPVQPLQPATTAAPLPVAPAPTAEATLTATAPPPEESHSIF